VNTSSLVVFVHVASAVVLVGSGLLATPAVNSAIRRSTTVSGLRRWLTVGRPLGRINPVSSVSLLASGVYLASVGQWWTAAWVQMAAALWIVNAILANALVKPSMSHVAQLAFSTTGDSISPELDAARRTPRLAATSDVMLASDLGVLFLMVVKPSGYLTALAVMVVAQLVLVGVKALPRPVLAVDSVGAE
jgi:hypothetical protein